MYARRLTTLFIATVTLSAGIAAAGVNPFTEEFVNDPADWRNGAGTFDVSWSPNGGPDGSSHVFDTFNFRDSFGGDTPVFFRGHDEYGSSGGAFVGDWISAGITEFSFWVRHDAPEPLTFFARFATPQNFPAGAIFTVPMVDPGSWTRLAVAISPANGDIQYEGGPSNFFTVFGNIGHVQIGVGVPDSLAGVNADYTFALDKVSIIPAPGALAVLGLAVIRPRRRRHA